MFKDSEVHISRDINDKELEQAVRFLHDNGQVKYGVVHVITVPPTVGTLLHYEDTVLNDFYFVDPQWLCDLLAHVVTVRQINPFVKDGKVPKSVCSSNNIVYNCVLPDSGKFSRMINFGVFTDFTAAL